MTWFGWALIALFAANAGMAVYGLGKGSDTPRRAALVIAVIAAVIVGILLVGTGSL